MAMALEAPQKRRLRRIDVVMGLIALVVIAFFVAAGIFFYIEKSSQQIAFDQVERRLSNLKARGIPIDAVSLRSTYISQTNPADGAAWTKIFEYLGSQDFRAHAKGIDPFYTWPISKAGTNPPDQLTLKRSAVQNNAELLKTVHELASHRQPVQLDLGFGLSSPRDNLSNLRLLVGGLLTWEMQIALADKDSRKAFESLAAQFDIVSIAQGEHLTIAHQVFAASKNCIFANVRQLTEANLLSQQELEGVIANLQTLPSDIKSWQLNVQQERAYLLPLFQRPFSDGDRPQGLPQEITQATAKDLAHFLHYMDRYESLSWPSWKTAKESLERIEADLKSERKSDFLVGDLNWRNTLFFINHTPVLSNNGWSHHAEYLAQTQSQQNQAIVACALRLYKIKHGSFPDRLDQLVDVGIDPKQYLSMADLPFGYECQVNIAYLWGPIQGKDLQFPFEIVPHRPQTTDDPAQNEQINQALWTLQP